MPESMRARVTFGSEYGHRDPRVEVGEVGLPLVRRDLRRIFDLRRDAIDRLLGV